MPKITLRIIAEETGLSKYAVSRALSGKSGVSEETRARVKEVAERLGYQGTRAGDTKVIGAIFKHSGAFNSELFMSIQTGIQEEAQRIGYSAQAHWASSRQDMLDFAAGCTGLITVNVYDEEDLAALQALGKPIVRNGWFEPLVPHDAVGGTDHESGSAVAKYLVGLGHREIVYVHGSIDLRGRRERLHGLQAALEQMPETIVYDVVWDQDSGFTEKLDALLASGARPTAFSCSHDDLALTTITDLMARGWRIPDDASVVGFGDFNAARFVRPPLTTLRTNGEQMGHAAVRMLQIRLTMPDWPATPWRIRVPYTFVERQSSGPAPKVARQDKLFAAQ